MSRMRPMNRMRRNRALLAILAGLIAWAGAEPAGANSTSFATAGTGTFAPSIAWLDFTGYSDAAAAAEGLPIWRWLAKDAPVRLPLPEIQIFGGGVLGGLFNSSFGRAIVTGAGFGIGDDLINKIF